MKRIIGLLLLLGSFAWAGPRVNNGGSGYACIQNGKADWIHPLEIFFMEGRLPTVPASEDAWSLYANARAKIDRDLPQLAQMLRRHDVDLKSAIKFTPLVFEATGDSDVSIVERLFANQNCNPRNVRYVQIANYQLDGTLLISQPIWEDPAMTEQDKAILLMHEIIYKALREEFNEPSARRARAITSIISSSLPLERQRKQVELWLDPASITDIDRDLATPTFAVKLTCAVSVVDFGTAPATQLAFKKLEDIDFGFDQKFELGGFDFHLQTAAIDGVISSISIAENSTGVVAERKDGLRSAFLSDRKILHSLKRTKPHNREATVRCWNEVSN